MMMMTTMMRMIKLKDSVLCFFTVSLLTAMKVINDSICSTSRREFGNLGLCVFVFILLID